MDFKKNLQVIVMMAWRNVWKNKRRTALTLLTIFAGCAMIVFMNAFAKGGHDQMIEDAVSINIGHIQIHEKGFWDNRGIEYAFKPDEKLYAVLNDKERVEAHSRRVHAGGLVSFKNNTAGAMIQAVEPDREKRVCTLYQKVLKGGRFLNSRDATSIVMGEVLAKNLEVKVGDTVAMLSQGFDGSIAAENLKVVGLFNSGNPEYDRGLVLMPFKQAMKTFTMMDYVTSIVIRASETDRVETVRDDIREVVNSEKIEVMAWDELMPELVQWIAMDDAGAYIFDFILYMIVAFGIYNTMQMAVFERTRELGIMLAIGTRPGQVTAMVLFESVFITIIGIALGLGLGAALSVYFEYNPVNVEQYAAEVAAFKVNTTIFPARITWVNATVTALLTLLLSLVFTVFPARRAAALDPIDAIRHL